MLAHMVGVEISEMEILPGSYPEHKRYRVACDFMLLLLLED